MKTKVKKTRSQLPGAWVVNPNDKGRKSIKGGSVYLENEEEFMIELFNPLKKCVLADIRLNGESISETGLMIRPGQREYLDCFVDSRKKFIFKTYSVEDTSESMEAIVDNGMLEIFFYKEETATFKDWKDRYRPRVIREYYPWYVPYNPYPYNPSPFYYNTCFGGSTTGNAIGVSTTTTGYSSSSGNVSNLQGDVTYTSNCNLSYNASSGEIETGRIENGEKSKQKFKEVDMDFEKNYIHHLVYKLLPESRKPVEVKTKKMDSIKIPLIESLEDKEFRKKLFNMYEDDTIELIKKLADLKDAGILTEDEFKSKKENLLARI